MRIAVIGEFEAGSHRAHAINVVKTAGGFARLGHEVIVLCRAPVDGGDGSRAGEAYGEPGLRWLFAPADKASGSRYGGWAAEVARSENVQFVFARSFAGGLAAAEVGLPTVIETHAYIDDANPQLVAAFLATRRAQNPVRGIVTISPRLQEHYLARGAIGVHVVPDGVDLDLFVAPSGAGAVRPGASALYAGHLYDYKGIPTILDAASLLPGTTFELVGGTPEDVSRVRARVADAGLTNIIVHGAVDHARVPPHLWGAGVLLLPPSAREPSAAWTSPVKLGEYLASGRPIVASRIEGLKMWVDEPAVRWFNPDDAGDLARAIHESLAETSAEREVRQRAAAELARRYAYPARASAILRAGGVEVSSRAAALEGATSAI